MSPKFPFLVALPHSSNLLPAETLKIMTLSDNEIKNYLDIGSEELYAIDEFHLFPASYSRLFCDLNRAPDHEVAPKDRQGMIMETTYLNKGIYSRKLTQKEKSARIAEHQRFYDGIKKYIQEHAIRFILSAHTMDHLLPNANQPKREGMICLSNNDFATCSAKTTNKMKTLLEAEGYTVSINTPFKGGYLINSLCHREVLPGLQLEFSFTLIGNLQTQSLDPKKLKNHKEKLKKALLAFAEKEI